MEERSGAVTFKGNPMTLVGESLSVGQRLPEFTLLDNALNPVSLSAFAGKPLIIASVLSLDTFV
jgi:thiol peroxidase